MEGAPTLPLDGGTDERPRGATGRLFATGRLYGIGLLDLTLEDTLPASLALLGYLGGLLFASGRMPVGAEEASRSAASTWPFTPLKRGPLIWAQFVKLPCFR